MPSERTVSHTPMKRTARFSGLFLFDIALAPDNTFYVQATSGVTGKVIHMDLAGNTLGSFDVPVSDSPGFLSPEGFGLDPTDGSFWFGLVNSGNVLHTDNAGNLLNQYFVGGSPNDADCNGLMVVVSRGLIKTPGSDPNTKRPGKNVCDSV